MIKEKMYDLYSINNVDGLLKKCLDKDAFLEALENSTPISTDEFNSEGSEWSFWDYYDTYEFLINGNRIYIQTLMEPLSTFLDFLIRLAYYDNEKLIVSLEDEGSYMAITSIPLEDNKVRFSVFEYGIIYDKKILSDIIIDKTLLISEFNKIFKRVLEDLEKSEYREHKTYLRNDLSRSIDIYDMYLDNPACFKSKYQLPKYYRVFNIAYKTLENGWKFTIAFEDNDKCELKYWENKKQAGEILDYDIIELDAMYKDDYNYEEYREFAELEVIPDEILAENYLLNEDRLDDNWFHSPETNKWYAPNEIAPRPKKIRYSITSLDTDIIVPSYEEQKEKIVSAHVYSIKNYGHGDLECNLIGTNYYNHREFVLADFNYRYVSDIKEALKKVQEGESVRVIVGNIMQVLTEKTPDGELQDRVDVIFYDDGDVDNELLTSFYINRESFIEDFSNLLNKIENQVKAIEGAVEKDEELEISKKFATYRKYEGMLEHLDNFIGNYACATTKYNLAGIVNKNFEWVVNSEHRVELGRVDELGISEALDKTTRFRALKNIDGNYFIATMENDKQVVIDINCNVQIPYVSDKIYYQYLNDELFFVVIEKGKSFIVNSKGEDILTLDFTMGKDFWLFDDVVILSKNDMFGIINWSGETIIDFIFSDIKPEKNNLDFIPVKYIDKWGFISSNGKIYDMKMKDKSEADSKCSQVK